MFIQIVRALPFQNDMMNLSVRQKSQEILSVVKLPMAQFMDFPLIEEQPANKQQTDES